jgi:hypothetical protein
MVVTLLDGGNLEPEQFTATQSTADEHGEHGVIPQIPWRCQCRRRHQPAALFWCEPVAH